MRQEFESLGDAQCSQSRGISSSQRVVHSLQGLKAEAHTLMMRALQLGALLGLAVGVSQAAWCWGPSGGAAGIFTRDPAVIAGSNSVLLLIYACMVRF